MSFTLLKQPGFKDFFTEYSFKRATKTQKSSIAPILEGKNCYVLAPTGSGKTLAYLLPLFELLKKSDIMSAGSTRAVIITPTRELSNQVFGEAKKISHHVKLKVRKLLGGYKSTSKADIMITTPKTLLENVRRKRVNLSQLEFLICDEADQMFEGGFEKEMMQIISKHVKKNTHLLLFSATHNFYLESLFHNHEKFKSIEQIVLDDTFRIKKEIKTINLHTTIEKKIFSLEHLLKSEIKTKTVCFFNKRQAAVEFFTKMSEKLKDKKIFLLHGDLMRKERDQTIEKFRNSKKGILFTSDVLSRGIDIRDLDIVINISLPKNSIYYLHRIGRVARAKSYGTVINFVTQKDERIIAAINNSIKEQTILKIKPIELSSKKKKNISKKNKIRKK